jgi:hypothetical protein
VNQKYPEEEKGNRAAGAKGPGGIHYINVPQDFETLSKHKIVRNR